jgi:hypothetical protein
VNAEPVLPGRRDSVIAEDEGAAGPH